jgi:threonine dehydrogenase-like Zn-dependent dehydrogenase
MLKKLVAQGIGKVVLKKYNDIQIAEGNILVRTEYSSCKHGTEAWILSGKAHWLKHRRYSDKMRIFDLTQESQVFPVPIGEMSVGVVEKIGKNNKNINEGDKVYLSAGAQDTHNIPIDKVSKIQKGMSFKDALCIEAATFAHGAIRDSHIRIGDRVGVFGLGAIGLLTIQMAKLQGAKFIVGVDPIESRRKLALKMGANFVLNPIELDVGYHIRKNFYEEGLDVTIDFSGQSKALNDCIRSTGYGGTVIAGALYKPATSDLKLGMEFHWNRIKLISSRVSNEPDLDYPRWSWKRNKESVIDLMEKKLLSTEEIITPIVPFNDAETHFNKIIKNKNIDSYLKLTFVHT